jgi:hypothetical protein
MGNSQSLKISITFTVWLMFQHSDQLWFHRHTQQKQTENKEIIFHSHGLSNQTKTWIITNSFFFNWLGCPRKDANRYNKNVFPFQVIKYKAQTKKLIYFFSFPRYHDNADRNNKHVSPSRVTNIKCRIRN